MTRFLNSLPVGWVLLAGFFSLPAPADLIAQPIPVAEYAARRAAALDRLPDGLLLLHARTGPKDMEQPGWVQEATFFYFTGLLNLPAAVLVLDGPRREARLFVPGAPESFGFPVAGLVPPPGEATARTFGLTAVEAMAAFVPFVERRMEEGTTRFYVDEARRPEATGVPAPLAPVAGDKTLWRYSLAGAFPTAEIRSAAGVIRALRWVKSPAEVAFLRDNARATAAALLAGIRYLRPGTLQREAEVAVVAGCIDAGAQGPSFWPWLMSGPNTRVDYLVRAFFDYDHLNRRMQAGELVRVDVGCAGHGYGGDVGRTVPVSGTFTAAQREIWDVFVAAYRAGVDAIEPGMTRDDVFAVSRAWIARRREAVTTPEARKAVARMLDPEQGINWHLHGVGVESGETALDTLVVGAVFAYEPMFTYEGEAYYLEDMIAVTPGGHEVLSAGLPYTAEEIERTMARR